MTAARWSFRWSYAGRSGVVEDVDVRWSERTVLAGESTTAVTVTALVDVNLSTLAVRHHPHTGIGSVFHRNVPKIGGPWRSVRYQPIDGGRTLLEVTIGGGAQDEDTATFPPVTSFRPNINRRVPVPGAEPVEYTDTLEDYYRNQNSTAIVELRQPKDTIRNLFPNLADQAVGAVWPWVYGAPGAVASTETATPAVPAYMVKATAPQEIMIAGHPVEATSVTIFGPEAADPTSGILVSDVVPVYTKATDDGRQYAYVKSGDLTLVTADPAGSFYTAWTEGRATDGRAGQVLRRILEQSSVRVDLVELARVSPVLDRYVLAGYADPKDETPMGYAMEQIVKILPVSIVDGPNGKRPVLHPWASGIREDGPHLIDGASIVTDNAIEYATDGAGPAAVLVGYAYNPDVNAAQKFAQSGASTSARAAAGVGVERMETYSVHSPATASMIARDRLRALTWAPRVVRASVVSLDEHEIGGARPLDIGQAVRLTSTRLGLSAHRGTIGEIERDGDGMSIAVYLDDDPLTPTR